MGEPFVSVLIPAFNHEAYVAQAIESVLQQTWDDLELIVVNDGSRDRTGEIARGYTDPRLRYFEHENRGAHATLNRGLELSRGRAIAILNSDDVYHPGRLAFLIEQTADQPDFLAFTNLRYVDSRRREIDDFRMASRMALDALYTRTRSVGVALARGNLAVTTSNIFMSAGALARIGTFAPYRYVHDYDFLLRAVLAPEVRCLYFQEATLLDYRVHDRSTVGESRIAVLSEQLTVLREHASAFARPGIDPEIAAAALGHRRQLEAEVRMRERWPIIERARRWPVVSPLRQLGWRLRRSLDISRS